MRVLTAFLLFVISAFSFTQFGASAKTVRYRTIASGTYSTITRAEYRTAMDIGVLENYWTQILKQGGRLPMVDFTKDRVAIFFLGQRNSGGYSLSVQGIFSKGGATGEVRLAEVTPAAGSTNTMALSQPWVMVAVDRSCAEFNLNYTQIQAQPALPWIATGPTSAFLPAPWSPCFNGYGGNWPLPCGYLFDDWNSFNRWGYENDLYYDLRSADLNWSTHRLAYVSGGSLGIGFNLSIAGVQMRGNVAVVQVTRQTLTQQPVGARRSPFLTLTVQRSVQQIQVELLEPSSGCFMAEGNFLDSFDLGQLPQSGTYMFNNTKSLQTYFGSAYSQLGEPVRQFNYRTGQLAVVNLGRMRQSYKLMGVVYRGSQAVLQFSPNATGASSREVAPYYLVKLEQGAKSVGIEEVPATNSRRRN